MFSFFARSLDVPHNFLLKFNCTFYYNLDIIAISFLQLNFPSYASLGHISDSWIHPSFCWRANFWCSLSRYTPDLLGHCGWLFYTRVRRLLYPFVVHCGEPQSLRCTFSQIQPRAKNNTEREPMDDLTKNIVIIPYEKYLTWTKDEMCWAVFQKKFLNVQLILQLRGRTTYSFWRQ